jgi:lipopolysaccharide export system ATP-binding protein
MIKKAQKTISRAKRPAASTKSRIVVRRKLQTKKPQGKKLIAERAHKDSVIAIPESLPPVPVVPEIPRIILRSSGLVKRYKKRAVVNDVSIQVKQGEIVGLLGPNGAGKTTTFYMIVGMIRPNAGSVFMDDVEITKMPMYKRARNGISYLPQEPSVFRRLSVRDNLMAILQTTSLNRKEQEEKCNRLMDEFGLTHIAASKGFVLSGGERRRTEIARALALDPKFILLDEPFAGIDPIAVEDIMQIVIKLKNKNIGVLITDHNVHETLSITDRSYLLFEGRILKSGTAEYLANDPEAKKLYLGENFKLDRYE